jgi:hypothetical protein
VSNTASEQNDITFNEWAFNIWTDSNDWCVQCDKKNNKLEFDDKTKTTRCTQCGYVETYEDTDWKILQAQRYVAYQYMPGKYFFNNLSVDAIFKKYLRELSHVDWSSWLIHDYVLARMRGDKAVQDKLRLAAKIATEKMSYDRKPWKTLFEKMDAPNAEIFFQVPQIIYEAAEKKFLEAAPKEELQSILQGYRAKLTSMYSYNRWKGDRVACWVTSEIIKMCDVDSESIEFYTELFGYDPFLEGFQEDIIAGKKSEINVKDLYIQWELRLADNYLKQSKAFVAVWAAYDALTAKLGIHADWPPTKVIPFDIQTVEKVAKLVGDPEMFRLYNLATDLAAIDAGKACWYAKNFIGKVKELLPKVTPIEQELAKSSAYIT